MLEVYLKRCWPGGEFGTAENIIIGSDLDGSSGSDEDVMVKVARIVLNFHFRESFSPRPIMLSPILHVISLSAARSLSRSSLGFSLDVWNYLLVPKCGFPDLNLLS